VIRDGDITVRQRHRIEASTNDTDKSETTEKEMIIRFIFPFTFHEEAKTVPDSDSVALHEVAAASAILCELFVTLALANRPFGLNLTPPRMRIQGGSIEFSLSSDIFAHCLGLLTICGDNAMSASIMNVASSKGRIVNSAGLLELSLTWMKQLLEVGMLPNKDSIGEADTVRSGWADPRYAYSSFVPIEIVRQQADKRGFTEAYVNYILNRSLPEYVLLRQYCRELIVTEYET
jgi:hypothetical protein